MKKFLIKITSIVTALALTLGLSVAVNPIKVQAAPVEIPQAALGIDVSRYQGAIDWSLVAQSGITFAMIRVGARTSTTGLIQEDEYVRYNLQEANKYGIKVGAYFYSTAVTAEEAMEEANFVANILDGYQITFPVAYDCENYNNKSSRQYPLNKAQRTALAVTWLDTITARGYIPMFYGNKNAMENSRDWDMSVISSKYKTWVAWYSNPSFPATPACSYSGITNMWQFTQSFIIAGVSTEVDLNVSYFDYSEIAPAKGVAAAPTSVVNNTQYTPVMEVITATTPVNIRTTPSTENSSNILAKLEPGMYVYRVGVGNNGWSQININGQIFYVSTKYITLVK